MATVRFVIVLAVMAAAIPALGQVIIDPYRMLERDHHHGFGLERHRGPDCRALRWHCLHKDELGEEGAGNCQRYREFCG